MLKSVFTRKKPTMPSARYANPMVEFTALADATLERPPMRRAAPMRRWATLWNGFTMKIPSSRPPSEEKKPPLCGGNRKPRRPTRT